MDLAYADTVFLGFVVGGVSGAFLEPLTCGNTLLGIGIGALCGVFAGWYVAEMVVRNWDEEEEEGQI
jgi:hypothetical protein